MAQILYTPVGDMVSQVRFMDPGTGLNTDGSQPTPTIFATGVYAKIEGIWSTTRASQLPQQIVTQVTHRITVRYMPGLRTRMFIEFDDVDAGTRTFTIEQIIDPDEKKVELRMLCMERNDGK